MQGNKNGFLLVCKDIKVSPRVGGRRPDLWNEITQEMMESSFSPFPFLPAPTSATSNAPNSTSTANVLSCFNYGVTMLVDVWWWWWWWSSFSVFCHRLCNVTGPSPTFIATTFILADKQRVHFSTDHWFFVSFQPTSFSMVQPAKPSLCLPYPSLEYNSIWFPQYKSNFVCERIITESSQKLWTGLWVKWKSKS